MSDIRAKFTENAEQFDALMVEMLAENEALKAKVVLAHSLFSTFMSTPYGISGHDTAAEVAAWMQSESISILDKLES